MFSSFASVLLLLSKLLNVVQLVNLPQRHHIAIPALMEAGGTQTVRWDTVKSFLPGIEQEINNSPREHQHDGSFRAWCRYSLSLIQGKREFYDSLLYALLGVIHQQLLSIFHPVRTPGLFIKLFEKRKMKEFILFCECAHCTTAEIKLINKIKSLQPWWWLCEAVLHLNTLINMLTMILLVFWCYHVHHLSFMC